MAFMSGFPLEPIEDTAKKLVMQLKQYRVDHIHVLVEQFLFTVVHLTGTAETPINWKEIQSTEVLGNSVSETLRWSWWCWSRIQLAYFYGEFEIAFKFLAPFAKLSAVDTAYFSMSPRIYFTGLTATGLAKKTGKRKYINLAKKATKEMEVLMKTRGLNNLHRCLLMQAELLVCIKGKPEDVKKAYDKAIATSGKAGFTHDTALGNELAGEYFLKVGDEFWAKEYLTRACELYHEWGALAKMEHLKRMRSGYVDAGKMTLRKSTMTSSVRHWVTGEDSKIHASVDLEALSGPYTITEMSSSLDDRKSSHRRKSTTSVLEESSTSSMSLRGTKARRESYEHNSNSWNLRSSMVDNVSIGRSPSADSVSFDKALALACLEEECSLSSARVKKRYLENLASASRSKIVKPGIPAEVVTS